MSTAAETSLVVTAHQPNAAVYVLKTDTAIHRTSGRVERQIPVRTHRPDVMTLEQEVAAILEYLAEHEIVLHEQFTRADDQVDGATVATV